MTCILEFNDAALCLTSDDRVLYRAPGIALVREPAPLFGEPALRLARTHPRQSNQQYLGWLNADPLPHPTGRIRHHADLVYLHMLELKPLIDAEDSPLLLAVPGVLTADQLGVLLGILQEVGIAVSGFVDSAVASAASRALAPGTWFHLDVLLQRSVITRLAVADQVSRESVEELADCGLARLLDGWVDVIADRFVRETRFDPLHSAQTEQQVYDQIYDHLQAGADPAELGIEIVQEEHRRRVDLPVSSLEERGAQRFRALGDLLPAAPRVLLGAQAARLPGLARSLGELGAQVHALPSDALVRGCLQHREQIVSPPDELRLITRLPARSAGPASAPPEPSTARVTAPGARPRSAAAPSARAVTPTHALAGARAWALDSPTSPLPVRLRDGIAMLQPDDTVALNGEPIDAPRPLVIGDRLSYGERDYLMIHVET